jgi:LAT3 family solute carrier family 43 protein 3
MIIWFQLLLSIFNLRRYIVAPAQYYVASIGYQLEQKGDDDGFYTALFTATYAGSALLAPVGGLVADRFGVGFGQFIGTMLFAISLLFLLSPSLDVQVMGRG